MTCSQTIRRIMWLCFGLVLAIASATALTSPRVGSGYADDVRVGVGHAYAIVGDLPVKHRDRVKPLHSMAIEEVKLIYGRSTIKLLGPDGKTTSSWEPVAALLDWSARSQFWDNQDFILVESLPLKRLLLGESIREQVRSLAGRATPALRRSLQALAAQPELTEADLYTAAQQSGEASTTGKCLNALAVKVGRDHEWLSPRVLEATQLQHEGHTLTFSQWVGEILDRKDRGRSDGIAAASKLTPIEVKATEVGERLFHYQAIREHKSPAIKPLDLLVVPRPFNEAYSVYSTASFEKGMKPNQTLSPLEANVANTLVEYLQGLQSKDWALPGEDAVFDQKLAVWLAERSPWIPLGIILGSDVSELAHAGLPAEQVVAFRKCYRDLEDAERAAPGNLPEAIAVALTAAARDLGTSLGEYPEPAAMARESRLNRFAPFSRAPIAYGFGLVLLLLSLGIRANLRTPAGKLGAALYCLGMVGLMVGIALELYGFWHRFRISRWGPVTTMYETVVWVALATAGLGLAFELLWRKKHAALAASGIALLATVLAQNVSLLDPSIRAVLPELRSNRWLVGHVLTIASSYAAFALALGLGLLAVGHYLTATYRRSPSYSELAWPLLPGIPLYALGRLGIDSSYRPLLLPVLDPQWLGFVSLGLAALGGVLTIVGGFSLLGELANRSPRRACVLGVILAAVGSTGLIAVTTGAVQGSLASALDLYDAWLVGLVGGALIVMSLLGVHAREDFTRIEPLANVIYRAMQVGALFLAVGMILGGAWAHYKWGGFWRWDPKEVLALVTLLVYLVPLHCRFAGWMNTFGLVAASVVCFIAVLMSWYGANFVLPVGLHHYGNTGGGDWRIVMSCSLALLAVVGAAAWRRSRAR
ncbi:cytochrome c biogenesis protein CcsA [Singulisphaera sp. Ch08]|uniref:Cytochrome c biogenesis protein CcsA n=1 Tax=Singulisphaera sp. Ch08 TaxID=3120278 RepID=A0AAU7CDW2_9BACT